jgi:hypothetical protein
MDAHFLDSINNSFIRSTKPCVKVMSVQKKPDLNRLNEV